MLAVVTGTVVAPGTVAPGTAVPGVLPVLGAMALLAAALTDPVAAAGVLALAGSCGRTEVPRTTMLTRRLRA